MCVPLKMAMMPKTIGFYAFYNQLGISIGKILSFPHKKKKAGFKTWENKLWVRVMVF